MSETKRYTLDYTFTGTAFVPTTREVSDGEYVAHADYAALQAENERLRSASFVTAVPSDEYEKLTAENEVLRKKVEWLQKADRLVIWNGTEWQVRHVVEQPIKPRE